MSKKMSTPPFTAKFVALDLAYGGMTANTETPVASNTAGVPMTTDIETHPTNNNAPDESAVALDDAGGEMTLKAMASDTAGEEMMLNNKTMVATNAAPDEAKEAHEATQEEVEPSASVNRPYHDPERSSQPGDADSVFTPPTAGKVVYDIDKDSFAPTPQSVRTHVHEIMDVNTAIFTDPPSTADESRPYCELMGTRVTWNSMFRFREEQFLNDEIIGFYFLLLQEREFAEAQREGRPVRVLFLDTQFTREFSGTDIYFSECEKVNRRIDKMHKRYGVTLLDVETLVFAVNNNLGQHYFSIVVQQSGDKCLYPLDSLRAANFFIHQQLMTKVLELLQSQYVRITGRRDLIAIN
jgi:hypothetical protein